MISIVCPAGTVTSACQLARALRGKQPCLTSLQFGKLQSNFGFLSHASLFNRGRVFFLPPAREVLFCVSVTNSPEGCPGRHLKSLAIPSEGLGSRPRGSHLGRWAMGGCREAVVIASPGLLPELCAECPLDHQIFLGVQKNNACSSSQCHLKSVRYSYSQIPLRQHQFSFCILLVYFSSRDLLSSQSYLQSQITPGTCND